MKHTAHGKPPEFQNYFTAGELAEHIGKTERTVRRWYKSGRLPEPAVKTPHGWKLWSPAQVREIIDREVL